MNRATRKLSALIVTASLALAGCASSTTNDAMTLTSTKSPAQALRNEIAGRIPSGVVDGIVEADHSESCDAKGLVRSWRSTATASIAPLSAGHLESITDDLVASFVDQGWEASTRDASSKLFEYRLTSDTSSADVRITGDLGNDDRSDATVLIVVNGPCVVTEGPDSAEVKRLENRE